MGFKFAIDRGGTFTDVYVEYPDKSQFVYKLLSEDYHYQDAPSEAIRRLISKVNNQICKNAVRKNFMTQSEYCSCFALFVE